MTIEEKAKAYDEALKVLHKYDGANIMFSQSLKEEMFPELKETEDECMRIALIKFTHENQYMYTNYNGRKIAKEEFIMRLKKQGEQKLAWSKEDETMATNIIIMLKEGASLHFNKNDIAKGVDWLKSLRPQNIWRPSDEQMVALKEACDEHWEPDGLDPLYTLYQDLKKLKE